MCASELLRLLCISWCKLANFNIKPANFNMIREPGFFCAIISPNYNMGGFNMKNKASVLIEEEKEVEKEQLDYGIACIVALAIPLAIAAIFAVILERAIEMVLLMACLFPLREHAGGFHFSNRRMCSVVSTLIFILQILAIKYWEVHRYIAIAAFIVASIPIAFFAPVGNKNRNLDLYEKEKYGDRAKTIWLVQTFAFFVLWILNLSRWYIIILVAVMTVGMLVSIGYIQEKIGYRNREENV